MAEVHRVRESAIEGCIQTVRQNELHGRGSVAWQRFSPVTVMHSLYTHGFCLHYKITRAHHRGNLQILGRDGPIELWPKQSSFARKKKMVRWVNVFISLPFASSHLELNTLSRWCRVH